MIKSLNILALTLAAALAVACAPVVHAGIPEVLAAEKAIEVAKEQKKAAEKALTKEEKAELAVARAQAKLNKIRNAD